MKAIKLSTAILAMSFAIFGGLSAQASSTAFLCGLDLSGDPEAKTTRRSEMVLTFFLDDDEVPELDPVIQSYQMMTRGLPTAQIKNRVRFKDLVLEAFLWQGPVVEFRNTFGTLFENKHLIETLLNESPVYAKLLKANAGQTLQLRKTIRAIR